MTWLLSSLALLGILAFVLGKMRRFRRPASPAPDGGAESVPEAARPEGCCGQHAVCEKDSLLAAVSRGVEYFEDEELDRFRGRPSGGYTPEEVPAWVRSLQLRGLNLPDALRDEVILLVGEQRDAHAAS